jgi:RND superfamily putative drug exporter
VPDLAALKSAARAAIVIPAATVIRALLVPALMKLLGNANWWMRRWASTLLRIPHREPVPEVVVEGA